MPREITAHRQTTVSTLKVGKKEDCFSMPAAGSADQIQKRKNFDSKERDTVIRHLLAHSNKGVLPYDAYTAAADKFGCEYWTIPRSWRTYYTQQKAGVLSPNVESSRKGKSGRKGIPLHDLQQYLRDVPFRAVLNENDNFEIPSKFTNFPLAWVYIEA